MGPEERDLERLVERFESLQADSVDRYRLISEQLADIQGEIQNAKILAFVVAVSAGVLYLVTKVIPMWTS